MRGPVSKNVNRDFLSTGVRAATKAGKIILDNIGKISKGDIESKQASDFVTRVDRESEEAIVDIISKRFPDHHFLAEESMKESGSYGYRWIIDPLDGTTNYIHQFPVFSISIALEFMKDIVLGIIFDPIRNEMFTAEKGKGSFLNNRRIHISSVRSMNYSLIATGFPFRKKDLVDRYLKLFKNIFLKVSDLRRAGSAALDLASVASGRCEGFFEIGLSPWDIAAGSILIKEAGGFITDFGGGHDYLRTGNVVAGVPPVHKELLEEIKDVFSGIIDI